MTVTRERDPYFAMLDTDSLLREREVLGWDRVECEQSDEPEPTRSNGLQFIDLQISSIDHELERREALRRLPGAPAWPSEPTKERQQLVRDIKDHVSVLTLYHQYFPLQPLRKMGRSWRGRCVFHGGNNPTALSVFNDGRNWYCHNCGAGGDVFAMAQLILRTTNFPEVVDRLANMFGIAISVAQPGSPETSERAPRTVDSEPTRLVRVRVGA